MEVTVFNKIIFTSIFIAFATLDGRETSLNNTIFYAHYAYLHHC